MKRILFLFFIASNLAFEHKLENILRIWRKVMEASGRDTYGITLQSMLTAYQSRSKYYKSCTILKAYLIDD
jgi:hypothetical protein